MNLAAAHNPLDLRLQRIVFIIVAAAAALVPLESFLIALCAKTGFVPDQALFAGQFAIEGVLYLALAAVVWTRLLTGRGFRRTPADLPLLVILVIALLAIALNHAPLRGSLMNLRSALRYVAVFYLVTQAGLSRKQVGVVLWVILISGAVQVGVGAWQWVVGEDLKQWMQPYTTGIEVAGQSRNFVLVERGREIGSLFGTLGDTLYFGLFLVIVLSIALTRLQRWRGWYGFDLFMIALAIAYSYSRAAVIVTGLTLAVFAANYLGVRRIAGVCCLVTGIGLLVIGSSLVMETHGGVYHHPRQRQRSIVANMTNIFSADYLERSKRQRLGALLGVAPTSLMNAPVIGFGPDQTHTLKQLNEARKTRLYKTMTQEGFEDVYWIALLCYTGILGMLAVLWLGVRLAWASAWIARAGMSRGDPVVRWAGLAALCIVGQAAVLMWFNRVPELRPFSFYLWLLPALAIATWADSQKMMSRADQSMV